MSFSHWDSVLLIWEDIARGMAKNSLTSESSFGFPDHPTEVIFRPLPNGLVDVFLNGKFMAATNRNEILSSVIHEGKLFFNKLILLNPENQNSYTECLSLLDSIKI